MLWQLTRCTMISSRSPGPILREPLWTEGQMRRLQRRGVPLLCPPQGDEGHCRPVPCLQGRLSLERLHYHRRVRWDFDQDARPSFERRPNCLQEVLCQGAWSLQGRRGQTWCVPLPAEQVPVQQRRPRQTDHSQIKGCVSLVKPSAFVVSAYNQRRFNKTGLLEYIFVGYCFTLFHQSAKLPVGPRYEMKRS